MTEELKMSLRGIRKKINKSSGCGYLYHHFDNVCSLLEDWKNTIPNDNDIQELAETIEAYANECYYCNYKSLGWFQYAARSFYCANYLVRYFPDEYISNLQYSLNVVFERLMDSEAISFVEKELFDKYFYAVDSDSVLRDRYYRVIQHSTYTASMHHPVEEEVEYMAYHGCRFSHDMIMGYISKFDDTSHLKEWIPRLNTPMLANIWYRFPDDVIKNPYGHRQMIERVESYLDKSLELHLRLWNFWFEVNPKEVLDYNDAECLIEILDVSEDDSFIEVMNKLIEFPYNDKVLKILMHFKNDDEDWIARLSNALLYKYESKRRVGDD